MCRSIWPKLDSYIEKYKTGRWNVSRTAMAIEVLCLKYVYAGYSAASINEAVQLAKKYEQRETVSFINGVLGSFIKEKRTLTADLMGGYKQLYNLRRNF